MNNIEANIYKILYEKQSSAFARIIQELRNCVEYKNSKPDEVLDTLSNIIHKEKWDYCGIQNKEDTAVVKVLENLLKSDQ